MFLFYLFVMFFVGGFSGLWFGGYTGHDSAGFFLGWLFGPIGWILVLLLPPEGPRCPECFGVVDERARRCMHCGSTLPSKGGPQA